MWYLLTQFVRYLRLSATKIVPQANTTLSPRDPFSSRGVAPVFRVTTDAHGKRRLEIEADHIVIDADRIDLAPNWSPRRKSTAAKPVSAPRKLLRKPPEKVLALKARRSNQKSVPRTRHVTEVPSK